MNRLTPLILSLVFLIVAICAYTFLSFETAAAISLASLDRGEATVSSAQGLYAESVLGLLKETAEDRIALAAFVPTDQTAPGIIQELQDAATREKLSATVGSVAVLQSSWNAFEPLEVKLSSRGGLAALVSLATDLESLPQVSHLSSFSVQSTGNHTWFATYAVDFVKVKSSATL